MSGEFWTCGGCGAPCSPPDASCAICDAPRAATRADGRQPGTLPPNRFHAAAWIVGDRHRIAADVWIGAFCVIDAAHDDLTIGAGSVIAAGAQLYTHSTVARTATERRAPLAHAPTVIGEHVSVCAGAIVLMGARIGHHSVVGAGSVVQQGQVVPPYSVLGGVPSRPLYRLSPRGLAAGKMARCDCYVEGGGRVWRECQEHAA